MSPIVRFSRPIVVVMAMLCLACTRQEQPGLQSAAPSSPPPEWPLPLLVEGDWQEIEAGQKAGWVRRMQEAAPEDWKAALEEVSRLRIVPLDFYPGGRLVEALIHAVDAPPWAVSFVLLEDDTITFLNGTSPPVHQLNEHAPLHLDTEERTLSYLKFFNNQLSGKPENFRVVESLDDFFHQEEMSEELKSSIGQSLAPPVLKRLEDGNWEAKAVILDYGGYLFKANYLIQPGGMIEMQDDEALQKNIPKRGERFMGLARTARQRGESAEPLAEPLVRLMRNGFSAGLPPHEQIRRSAAILEQPDAGEEARFEALLLSADASFALNDYSKALDGFNALLVLRPRSAEALLGRGRTLFYLERREEALQDLAKALELKPGYTEVHARRYGMLFAMERTEEALAEARLAAEGGHRDGMYILGWSYLNGQGVTADAATGIDWLRKAAEAGSVLAMFQLGYCHDTGQGVPEDAATALSWFRRAALLGDPTARRNLAVLLYNGKKIEGNPAEAFAWFELDAMQGHAHSQYMTGVCWNEGHGVKKQPHMAEAWFSLAAEQGHDDAARALGRLQQSTPQAPVAGEAKELIVEQLREWAEKGDVKAQYSLARAYVIGLGIEKDEAEAQKWYRLAAAQGHDDAAKELVELERRLVGIAKESPPAIAASRETDLEQLRQRAEMGDAAAQFTLGVMYTNGRGVPTNEEEAVKWFRLAADQGNASAQSNLGVMYASGRGVPKNETEAVKWYRLAADQGNTNAQSNLGGMYANGRGVPKDEAEAVKWYRLAAEQGQMHAQSNLGVMYEKGRGVAKDEAEAVKWLQQAAKQGHAASQLNLAWRYKNGWGFAKDEAEAAKWFHLAAEQGQMLAQSNLGVMYENGQGVAKNETEAVKWYRLAAEQGHAASQLNLARRYESGQGVTKDEAEASKWYQLAKKNPNADDPEWLQNTSPSYQETYKSLQKEYGRFQKVAAARHEQLDAEIALLTKERVKLASDVENRTIKLNGRWVVYDPKTDKYFYINREKQMKWEEILQENTIKDSEGKRVYYDSEDKKFKYTDTWEVVTNNDELHVLKIKQIALEKDNIDSD